MGRQAGQLPTLGYCGHRSAAAPPHVDDDRLGDSSDGSVSSPCLSPEREGGREAGKGKERVDLAHFFGHDVKVESPFHL